MSRATSEDVTLSGYLVDSKGTPLAWDLDSNYTISVTISDTEKTFKKHLTDGSFALPNGAVGFVGTIDQPMYVGRGGSGDTVVYALDGEIDYMALAGKVAFGVVVDCANVSSDLLVSLNDVVQTEGSTHVLEDSGFDVFGIQKTTPVDIAVEGNRTNLQLSGGRLHVLPAGGDPTIGVQKTEQRFTLSPLYTTDQVVKSGVGFLHVLRFSGTDALPTAGTIDVYDGTDATGTKIDTIPVAAAVFIPFERTYNGSFATGLFLDFTTVADVAVGASYR